MNADQLNGYTDTSGTSNAAKGSDVNYIPHTEKFGNSQDGNPNTPDIPVTNTNLDPILSAGAGIVMALGGAFLVPKGYVTLPALAQIVTAVLSIGAMCYVTYKGTTKSKVSSLAKTLDVPKAALSRHIVAMKRSDGTWQA